MDFYQINWFIVIASVTIGLSVTEQNENIHENKERGRVRVPKFEFFIYNDAGNMVKQLLTVKEIQQLLLQQSLRLGEECLDLKKILQFEKYFQD